MENIMSYRKNKHDLINKIAERELRDNIRDIVNIPYNAWEFKNDVSNISKDEIFCLSSIDNIVEKQELYNENNFFTVSKIYYVSKNFFLSLFLSLYIRINAWLKSLS